MSPPIGWPAVAVVLIFLISRIIWSRLVWRKPTRTGRAIPARGPLGPGRDLLGAQAGHLKAAGADFFLLACNTVHTASERIEKLAGLPFLHIVDPIARQIQQAGFTTFGLPGSRYTMTGTYWSLPPGNFPGQTGHREGRVPDLAVCPGASPVLRPAANLCHTRR